jgi:formylmethanofuran dehydrogenase subunit E
MKTVFDREMEAARERLLAEQRAREADALTKRPKCERCGEWLLGGRAQQPPGQRICGTCERGRKG